MLFWICLIILIIGICAVVIGNMTWNEGKNKITIFFCNCYYEILNFGTTICLIAGLTFLGMIGWILANHINSDAYYNKQKEIYNTLCYKMNDEIYIESNLLRDNLISQIEEWNSNIAYKRTLQDNFWIGIFIIDVYDDLELIDYGNMLQDELEK